MISNIRAVVEQIRQEELSRYKKNLKGCENIVVEEVTQRFTEKFIATLENQLCKNNDNKSHQALAMLFIR